jgi:uncharacterized integral membrane protein
VKHFSWIITLPVAVVVVVFAANNVHDMTVDLWPVAGSANWPTYLVVLLTFLIGFLCGGAVMWLSLGRTRREARRRRAEAKRLSRELDSLRKAPDLPTAGAPAPARQLPAVAGR